MQYTGNILLIMGRNGPVILILSLGGGVFISSLAELARFALPLSAFLLTTGSLLTAMLSPRETSVSLRLIAICLIWTGIGLPILVTIGLSRLALEPDVSLGVMLSILAPPVGSAAAVAGMLGLRPRLALIGSLTLTLMSPLSMPALAGVLGLGVSFDVATLAYRLLLIIGAALAVSMLFWRFKDSLKALIPDARAASGIAVIGLAIVGLATANGLAAEWRIDPNRVFLLVGAATTVNLAATAIGSILFGVFGPRTAMTVGLVSGNRNVTLAWAAAGLSLPLETETYVAASVVPILALPIVVKFITSAWVARRPTPI